MMLASQSLLYTCTVLFSATTAWAGSQRERDTRPVCVYKRQDAVSVSISVSTVTVTVTAVAACSASSPVTATAPASISSDGLSTSLVTISPIPATNTLDRSATFTGLAFNFEPGFGTIPATAALLTGNVASTTSTTLLSTSTSTDPSVSNPSAPSSTVTFPEPEIVSVFGSLSDSGSTATPSPSTATPSPDSNTFVVNGNIVPGFSSIPATAAVVASSIAPASSANPSSQAPAVSPAAFFTTSLTAPAPAPAPASVSNSVPVPPTPAIPTTLVTSSDIVPGFGSIAASNAAAPTVTTTALSNSGKLGIGKRWVVQSFA